MTKRSKSVSLDELYEQHKAVTPHEQKLVDSVLALVRSGTVPPPALSFKEQKPTVPPAKKPKVAKAQAKAKPKAKTVRNKCLACPTGKRSAVFAPCGHMVVCEACATDLVRCGQPCPKKGCGKEVTSMIKLAK